MVDGKTCRVETDTGPQVVTAEHVVLATGSLPAALPALPFGGRVISSTEALSLPTIPERLAVVGAGYIGLELGTAFAKLGAKVTVIEAESRILPAYDAELDRPVARRLRALGVEVLTRARAAGLSEAGDALRVEQEGAAARSIPADRILVATGRRAGHGLRPRTARPHDERRLRADRRALRDVDAQRLGDRRPDRRADAGPPRDGAGRVVAESIAGHRRVFDGAVIPAVCFTDPEIVTVGLSPDEARKAGHEVHPPCSRSRPTAGP